MSSVHGVDNTMLGLGVGLCDSGTEKTRGEETEGKGKDERN